MFNFMKKKSNAVKKTPFTADINYENDVLEHITIKFEFVEGRYQYLHLHSSSTSKEKDGGMIEFLDNFITFLTELKNKIKMESK